MKELEKASNAMKISKLSWVLGFSTIAAVWLSPALSERAQAFGGFWSSQSAPVKQSSEKILFVDNADATLTAIVQIEYAGPAQNFAWLIPMPGTPTVAVSSSTVLERLAAATEPEYWLELNTHGMCSPTDASDAGFDAGAASAEVDAAIGGADTPTAPLLTTEQGSVGPYDYVTIKPSATLSDPAQAATDWLTLNGYDLTGVDSKVLGPYMKDGLNLLAFKLKNGMDAGAIRPVMLTYESKLPMIPIRPSAVAAQDDMSLLVWVIGPSQAVPSNYKSLVLDDAAIDWLGGGTFVAGTLPAGGVGPFGSHVNQPSNYDALVSLATHEAGGQGFVTELAGPASQYRDRVWSDLDAQNYAGLTGKIYTDGIDAIIAAGSLYAGWDGFRDALQSATTLPSDVTVDAFGQNPERYRGAAQVDIVKFLQLLNDNVVKPVSDSAALLNNAPYLTRLYSRMNASDMTLDPAFDYNFDLAQISNVHVAKQRIACSATLTQSDAPWHILLPQGGVVGGKGSGWPIAVGAIPANLEVVALSSSGSGNVVKDNSATIGQALFESAGTSDAGVTIPTPTQNGATIGGTQSVAAYDRAKSSDRGGCSVSPVGTRAATGGALGWPLAGLFLALNALRKRRLANRRALRTLRKNGAPRIMKQYLAGAWALLVVAGCNSGSDAPARADAGVVAATSGLTREQLRDPETCKGCHPIHYREWASSMHAYAAQDPVFIAMNKRGQRETHGELGNFCIKCHAPMAVADKLTRDGLDLERLPDKDRGVSCYFCHNVTSVEGDHNAMLHIADDTTMRGEISDPVAPGAHQAEFSEIFEDTSPKSDAMCGGCHDIVMANGVHLERTFQEYKAGISSHSATGDPPAFDSCVGCHMPANPGFVAQFPGVVKRSLHAHMWPGVDVPLTDFPNRAAMRSAVEDCQLGGSIAFFTLEVTPPNIFTFQTETTAGHNQPSGSSQDRRMWLEFMAYDKNGALLDKVSSGNIADGEIEDKPAGDPRHDPQLLLLRDRIYDAQDKPVHMFWEATKTSAHPDGYESNLLPVASTTYIDGKHALLKQYRASGPDGLPARVTARLRMRAVGIDVLNDLVASGDLDPAIVTQMPTFTLGAQLEWTPESGLMKTIKSVPKTDCAKYLCMLDASTPGCQ